MYHGDNLVYEDVFMVGLPEFSREILHYVQLEATNQTNGISVAI